jgi:hypothetical protein
MLRRNLVRALLCLASAPLLAPIARAEADPPHRKPDLGDAAEGVYSGDVISDSKGSSRSGVTLQVQRVGRNLVRITSDYSRLPVVEVPLTSAMGRIVQQHGPTAFVLDRAQARLDVSFMNEVSWAGVRR